MAAAAASAVEAGTAGEGRRHTTPVASGGRQNVARVCGHLAALEAALVPRGVPAFPLALEPACPDPRYFLPTAGHASAPCCQSYPPAPRSGPGLWLTRACARQL